jgi:hypothetical protein
MCTLLCLPGTGPATSVIDLLHHFFPEDVDRLSRESALVKGKLPTVVLGSRRSQASSSDGTDGDHGLVRMFGQSALNREIEFGAEQVILVRDNPTKLWLRKHIKVGLILTILDAKGLEFNDVMIFNFFHGSSFGRNWRVLYDLAESTAGVSGLSPALKTTSLKS